MSTLRFDYSGAEWVIFAPLRKLRPHSEGVLSSASPPAATSTCPFCPGNETLTPPEIFSMRSGADPRSWQVRVIPNKFPALAIEADHHRLQAAPMFRSMGGCGAHEVIVESPDHSRPLAKQSIDQIDRVLETARLRYVDLLRDPRFQTVIIFKNHGERAGTSLPHPHWQLIATPVVPKLLRMKHAVAAEYFDENGVSLYQNMLDAELDDGDRIVEANDHFAAFVPYAAQHPFEVWILPRLQQASYGDLTADQRTSLAKILSSVVLRLYSSLENPDFNLTIDTAPRGDEDKEYFRWHFRVIPRLATPAGFELGSGMSINTVLPEDAAQFLRDGAG
jgi:UDPglucose--hexose-1-phosphate uridylyltransferase